MTFSPWIDIAVIAATLIGMLWLGWMKWPDTFIDFGRELYVPWQLTQGKVLFSDIAYFNGPLSPYFNAAVFQIFGVSLRALILANLALLCLGTWAIHHLLSDMAGRVAALVGSVVFLTIFALAQLVQYGSYNFLSPYSHEMTHGVLLSLGTLVCLSRYLRAGQLVDAAGAGVFLGLVFLTKAEIFLAIAPALLVGLGFADWTGGEGSPPHMSSGAATGRPDGKWRGILALVCAALVPPVTAFALLRTVLPGDAALLGTLGSWPHVFVEEVRDLRFYRWVMGTANLGWNLGRLGLSIICYVAVLVPIVAMAVRIREPVRGAQRRVLAAIFVALGILAAVLAHRGADHVARPFPLIMGAVVIGLVLGIRHDRREGRLDRRWILSLSFAVFALLLLLKILLRSQFHHYGFVLAMPAAMAVVALLVGWLPEWVGSRGGGAGMCRAGMVMVTVAVVIVFVDVSRRLYQADTIPVGEGADRFVADYPGLVANRALDRVRELIQPGGTFAVLPEGVMLNYLARVENPTPYVNFMPPELILFGEDRILDAFSARPPDYCVLMNRGAYEYGFSILGRDYGVELMEWVQANYELVEQVRDEENLGKPFTLALIVRRIRR